MTLSRFYYCEAKNIVRAQRESIRKHGCMLHTYRARYSTDLCNRRTGRSGMMREINRLGYEPGRLSFYFCVARKDARRRLCAFLLLVDFPDTNNNLKFGGAHRILRILNFLVSRLHIQVCEFGALFDFFWYYLGTCE